MRPRNTAWGDTVQSPFVRYFSFDLALYGGQRRRVAVGAGCEPVRCCQACHLPITLMSTVSVPGVPQRSCHLDANSGLFRLGHRIERPSLSPKAFTNILVCAWSAQSRPGDASEYIDDSMSPQTRRVTHQICDITCSMVDPRSLATLRQKAP